MSQYRESPSSNFLTLISGAFIGAAGLALWLISEADKRKTAKKQKAMMYSSRIQDGSETSENDEGIKDKHTNGDKLEVKVEQLNSAIADVRKQLEELGR